MTPDQPHQATRSSIVRYDLREYRGRSVTIRGTRKSSDGQDDSPKRKTPTEVWLVVDRHVDVLHDESDDGLPFAISQDRRRITQNVLPKTPL